MIKKIILISLICLFLLRPAPISAQPADPINPPQVQNQPTNQPNIFQQLLQAIIDFFGFLIFGTNYISKEYVPPSTYNTNEIVNNYTSKYNDYSSRAMPESVRMRRKGVYFYEVLTTNKYQNLISKSIHTPENDKIDCPYEISILNIVCFYSQKYQAGQLSDKILYERGSDEPTDYSKVTNCPSLQNNDQCYLNAYQNYQDIPQGEFYGKPDTAAVASTQLNESIRTIIPENRQGESAPSNNDTSDKTKAIVNDSNKQEESMLLNLIPDEIHDDIACDDDANINRDSLRKSFKCQLTEYKKGNTDCGFGGDQYAGGCGIEGEDWIKNGHGISQHGAHGLALSGYKYDQIIKKYMGDNVTTNTIKGNDDKDITVILMQDDDLNHNGVPDNDPNCTSLVENEEASIYNRVDMESGSGGIYLDGSPCQYETITKTRPGPNDSVETYYEYAFKVTSSGDKCYSTITLPVKNYLLGIAEVPYMWHVESLRALVIAFRHEVLGKSIVKSHGLQVFQCNRVIENRKLGPDENPGGLFPPKITNQRAAVELTKDEFVFENGSIKGVIHLTAFCGPGGSNPTFNGLEFELISIGYWGNSHYSINGICFEGIYDSNDDNNKDTNILGVISDNSIKNQSIPKTPASRSKTVSASLNGNLYYFNDTTRQTPIKENYDLADVNNAKWLTSFSNSTNCQLDSRVTPALTSLIEKLNQDIPNTSLIPKNCYRSYETQKELWTQGLAKYKDTYTNLIWHSYPGTSIHQTGRVIDFYDQTSRLSSSSPAYQWLLQNGSTYGFYHYKLEPWHWEYNP